MKKGFTLIELLLVIGIIAILASIVIVAINPTKQLGDARDAQRRSDVNTVLNAVYQYAIDHNGNLPSCIDTEEKGVCTSGSDCAAYAAGDSGGPATGCNLDVLTGSYLVSIPVDPQGTPGTSVEYTGYNIARTAAGRVTVTAPEAEQTATISVTR
ncbi:hypothetical protein COU80_01225 [Candidatus Peregrinibacteria bacterium CG10_big_fil_rev_8_21_14_0_10_55_24]|nr:MAG: hypothetical protein COU80_01225 [Candidatus Peregrinibacteria bacterium CG10_big_fil_rev_8_21_14_0_10_55_24]